MTQHYSRRVGNGDALVTRLNRCFSGLLDTYEAMQLVRDSPVPSPYIYLLVIATWMFVYVSPFIYNASPVSIFMAPQILILAFYGVLAIATQLEK